MMGMMGGGGADIEINLMDMMGGAMPPTGGKPKNKKKKAQLDSSDSDYGDQEAEMMEEMMM